MLEGERRRKRRRREMCRKRQELIPEIPFHLVTEILTKLPAKSLMRFKSVSKLWSSLIRSRAFTNRVQRVSSSSSLRLYLTMRFFDHNNQPQSKLLSTSSSSSTMSSFVIETNPGMIDYCVGHVFNGLMCFAKEQSSKIYNTTTRQLVVLPDIEESNILVPDHRLQTITYRIGHDPVCDQYKVVCIIARPSDQETLTFMSEHWVFLLGGKGGGGGDKSTSRWRKIPCPSPPPFSFTEISVNINGRMHYLAFVELLSPLMLVSFDFSSEEICLIQVPEEIPISITYNYLDPIEYYGKVALLDHSHLNSLGMMKLWVLEDAEKNMWSNKTLVVHPSQMDQVNSIGLRVQGTTRNNEIIFVPQNLKRSPKGNVVEPQDTTLVYIFLYDLQKNLLRKVEINETPYHTNMWHVVGFDDDVENFMYL